MMSRLWTRFVLMFGMSGIWIKCDLMPGNDGDAGAGGAGGNGDAGAGGAGGQQSLINPDQGSQGGQQGNGDFEIPEKFRVMGEGDQLDHKRTLAKVLESYGHLEKRIGSGDLPPKSADEYKIEPFLPEGLESDAEKMKPILSALHEVGLTNKQVQGVLKLYGGLVGSGMAQEKQSFEAAQTALKTEWGDKYEENLSFVNLAVNAYGTPEERQALSQPKYGTDPVILRLLAKVGADLRKEDNLPDKISDEETNDIDQLRTSEAYTNPKHADHARVKALVNAAYAKGYKART